MSAVKHTPGPWFATLTKGDFGHVSSVENPDDGGGDIATTWGVKGDAADHARLMAAAPDMRQALKDLVAYYEPIAEPELFPEEAALVEAARAAIAKAEGRTQ